MPATFQISRRRLLQTTGALTLAGLPTRLLAADPLKVAAIYTVPVEQQWVSRIHKAAEAAAARGEIAYVFTENTSNTDYERVMREYAEAGNELIVGEVFGVEQAARDRRARLSRDRLPHGLEPAARPGRPELLRLRQLHPGRELSHRHHCRRDDASPARSAWSAASRSPRSTA